jgi:Na+-translocating ferredoxin:NAD+ oxidoreductase RnfE subunit
MGPGELLRSVGMAMPYIFVAQGMFPLNHNKWASLEDYYLCHHRVLLGVLIIPTSVSFLYNLMLGYVPNVYDLLGFGIPLLVPAVLIAWSRPTVQWLGLALLSVNALALMFA